MVKCGVLLEVQAEFLNVMKTGTGFKQHASHAALPALNSSKFSPVVDASKSLDFKLIDKVIRNSKLLCLF
jgi:hypothetical protein